MYVCCCYKTNKIDQASDADTCESRNNAIDKSNDNNTRIKVSSNIQNQENGTEKESRLKQKYKDERNNDKDVDNERSKEKNDEDDRNFHINDDERGHDKNDDDDNDDDDDPMKRLQERMKKPYVVDLDAKRSRKSEVDKVDCSGCFCPSQGRMKTF